MLIALARLVRERPEGLGLGRHGVHGRRGVHPHRLEPPGGQPARGRRGDRGRADDAESRHPAQGGGPLEGPDARGRLPQLDPAPRPERDLPDGRGRGRAGRARRRAGPRSARTRSSGRRPSRSAGSRGAERQRRPRLVRDRDRPPRDPRRGPARLPQARRGAPAPSPRRGRLDRVPPPLGQHARPLAEESPARADGSTWRGGRWPGRSAGPRRSWGSPTAPMPGRSAPRGSPASSSVRATSPRPIRRTNGSSWIRCGRRSTPTTRSPCDLGT